MSCVNNWHLRSFTSRSEYAQSSNILSIDALIIHVLDHVITLTQNTIKYGNCNARKSRLSFQLRQQLIAAACHAGY
jgi:hypothetical protein